MKNLNLFSAMGVAVCEFPTSTGEVDYALFIDGTPVGIVEAKQTESGEKITTVEDQSARYAGNKFCKKITYTADDPEKTLSDFRNGFNPRIAVPVDMIATGTDVKPIECLIFMRDVRSKNYFEQMKGRGTRTLSRDDLQKVTPSATENKDHFVIVDAVGVTRSKKSDTRALERKPSVSLS